MSLGRTAVCPTVCVLRALRFRFVASTSSGALPDWCEHHEHRQFKVFLHACLHRVVLRYTVFERRAGQGQLAPLVFFSSQPLGRGGLVRASDVVVRPVSTTESHGRASGGRCEELLRLQSTSPFSRRGLRGVRTVRLRAGAEGSFFGSHERREERLVTRDSRRGVEQRKSEEGEGGVVDHGEYLFRVYAVSVRLHSRRV